MRLWQMTLKETWRRKADFAASAAAVAIGIAVVVAVRTVAVSLKQAVTEQVHDLGANLLVLPASSEVRNYYTADFGEAELPEAYAHTLNKSDLSGKVHDMMARLSKRIRIGTSEVVLTGVLPKKELDRPATARMAWKSGPLLREDKPAGDETAQVSAEPEPFVTYEAIKRRKKRMTIEELGLFETLLGSEVARELGVREGDDVTIVGKTLAIAGVLEETGTIDDIRVYAHLHTVQRLLGRGSVINMIEIVGCGCHVDVDRLGREVEALLPGTRAVTIRNIAQVQDETIKLATRLSEGLLVVIAIVAGVVVANHMVSNVEERRSEIGTLLALGATPATILRLFLGKAVLLGLVGGGVGFGLGTALAAWVGPRIAEVRIAPSLSFAPLVLMSSVGLCVLSSLLPAAAAATTDAARAFQE